MTLEITPAGGVSANDYSTINRKPMVIWDNYLTRGVFTFSSEVAEFPASHILTEATSLYWQPASLPAYLSIDMGAGTFADSVYIDSHDLGTVGATVIAQSSTDGIAWVDEATSTPVDDSPIMMLWRSKPRRYWRIRITGAGAEPFIGVAMISDRLVFPTGISPGYVPITLARETDVLGGESLGGHFLGSRVIKRGATSTAEIPMLEKTFVDDDMYGFNLHYDDGKAFAFASGPSVRPSDIAYCWRPPRSKSLKPNVIEDGFYSSFSMDLRAYVRT